MMICLLEGVVLGKLDKYGNKVGFFFYIVFLMSLG